MPPAFWWVPYNLTRGGNGPPAGHDQAPSSPHSLASTSTRRRAIRSKAPVEGLTLACRRKANFQDKETQSQDRKLQDKADGH
jgi:hypothetical protein